MVAIFGNATINRTTVWKPEPNFRGSWSLVSSCIITILLCVWSAVHLNVPEHRKTHRQFWRKLKWLLMGLMAPEIVGYVAWHQRRQAKAILRDVKRCLDQPESQTWFRRLLAGIQKSLRSSKQGQTQPIQAPSNKFSNYKSPWTMVHGFYVIMGGLAFDDTLSDEPFLQNSRTRAAITPQGLRFILKHEPRILPELSEDQIKDQSKADGLKKVLVCAQASWFCVQCLTRLTQSLSVSLLELNTFGHALCTLLIYFCWWHKPFEVEEPTLLRGEHVRPIFAYSWMSSKISTEGYSDIDIVGGARDEFDCIWPFRFPDLNDLELGSQSMGFDLQGSSTASHFSALRSGESPLAGRIDLTHQLSLGSEHSTSRNSEVGRRSPYLYNYRHRQAPDIFSKMYLVTWLKSKKWISPSILRFFKLPAGMGIRETMVDHLSPTDIKRWFLALQAIRKYDLEHDLRSRQSSRLIDYQNSYPRVKVRLENLHLLDGLSINEVWLGFAMAGLLYGGLHLVGWNAPFSSTLEKNLWRIASSSVTSTGIIAGPIVLWLQSSTASQASSFVMDKYHGRPVHSTLEVRFLWPKVVLSGCMTLFCVTLGPLIWFLYVLSRIYLLVECFKNVMHLPNDAFQEISWPCYFPHIG